MKIVLSSDHGGYELKEIVKEYLNSRGHEIQDVGCFSEESTDYPDWTAKAAKTVAAGEAERGIVFCGSGVGASIVANKVDGVRAVLCFSEYLAEYSRLHNNANVMALAGRLVAPDLAKRYVDIWLKTEYEGGRHQKRLDKITALERESL